MDRRFFLKTMGVAVGSFLLAANESFLPVSTTSKKKPNFLFILADDLGWKDIGCYGSTFYETPNLDRLAAEGMQFTDAYADPICSPTRAAIMSGKYPARLDTTNWFGATQPEAYSYPGIDLNPRARQRLDSPLITAPYQPYLPLEETTFASALKESGYATFFAGKWHLGKDEKYWPEHHGFDINKGGHDRGGPYGGSQYFSPYGNPRLEDGPDGEYLPLRLAEETVDFIEASKDKPFLAYLSFYKVHTPLMTTKELEEKYTKKREVMGLEAEWGKEGNNKVRLVQEHPVYAGMVEALDKAVGNVLDKLKEFRLKSDTIVIFMSDNGGLSTTSGHPTSNIPLRAGKGWLYEGGIRVPLIIKWPGVTSPGSTCSQSVIATDFYPTMLEMAGLPLRPDQHKDGKSFVPLLKGQKMTRGPIFWHFPHYHGSGSVPSGAVRDGAWKLIEFFETRRLELYDLSDDIGERNNLAEHYPGKVQELLEKMIEFRHQTDAKMPTLNPNYRPV